MRALTMDNTRLSETELKAIGAFAKKAADGSAFENARQVWVNILLDMPPEKANGKVMTVGDDAYVIVQGGFVFTKKGFHYANKVDPMKGQAHIFATGKPYVGKFGVTLDVVRLH